MQAFFNPIKDMSLKAVILSFNENVCFWVLHESFDIFDVELMLLDFKERFTLFLN